MSYRNTPERRIRQMADVFRQAGTTAIWRQYISASGGVPAAGIGETEYYREQVITALIYQGFLRGLTVHQHPVGQIVAGEFAVTTREQMNQRDELIWRGMTYRIESDPQPGRIAGTWVASLKRGD